MYVFDIRCTVFFIGLCIRYLGCEEKLVFGPDFFLGGGGKLRSISYFLQLFNLLTHRIYHSLSPSKHNNVAITDTTTRRTHTGFHHAIITYLTGSSTSINTVVAVILVVVLFSHYRTNSCITGWRTSIRRRSTGSNIQRISATPTIITKTRIKGSTRTTGSTFHLGVVVVAAFTTTAATAWIVPPLSSSSGNETSIGSRILPSKSIYLNDSNYDG